MLKESDLRPYQRIMIDHLLETPKCALFSFMGSGKTAATLTAIDLLQLSGAETRPALVIAPLRVARDVWPAEAQKWEHLKHSKVSPILGSVIQRKIALYTQADIYTVNYENVVWLIKECNGHWPFGMIVLDESTKVKSLRANIRKNNDGTEWVQGQGGNRAKAILKAIYKFGTARIIELTGTPAPNGLQDLWGQAFLLDYGKRLGRVFDAFRNRWFRVGFDGWGMEPTEHAQSQIETALKDICLSLKSEDWFDVKVPILRQIEVTLPPEARKKYKEMEKNFFTEIEGHTIDAFNAGAKTQKLLQFAAGAAYLGNSDDLGERAWVTVHDEKLDALEDIVEEHAGAPILVSYQFKSDLARILKRFPDARQLDQKSQTLKDWDAGKIPILVAHPASAGHGLNLQCGGNVLVYFSSGWNCEEDLQIAERIGPVRQVQSGFNRNVFHYRIVAKSTFDEDVLDVVEHKVTVQEAFLNAMRRRG